MRGEVWTLDQVPDVGERLLITDPAGNPGLLVKVTQVTGVAPASRRIDWIELARNPEVERRLEGRSWEVRRFSVEGLRAEPLTPVESRAVAALIEQLGADAYETRERATDQLEQWGPRARDAVTEATHSRDPEVRARARTILRSIRLPSDVTLIEIFRSKRD